nr:L-dopachrome tautomerase-related protein [Salinarimonas soli]
MPPRTVLLAGISLAAAVGVGSALARTLGRSSRLEQVASFPHQVTGITVTPDERIFVNFPRWTEDSAVSVAELMPDGSLRPYPDERWNAWRNARKNELPPDRHWVCVQSVVTDHAGALWVLDPAAPAQDKVVPGGPKLVRIDTATDRVTRTIAFDEAVAPQGSYLNDVRFSPDGRHAYITDSGARGAIVVVEVESGRARRVLDGHPSTQMEKDVKVRTDGRVLQRPDGRGVEFSADGIALTPDGRHLYWQAITGRTLYRIATDTLTDASLSPGEVAGRVERVGENGVADGLLITRDGRHMIITAVEENALKIRDLRAPGDTPPEILVQDSRLRWPDSLAEGPDGAIYFTTSRIQDSALFDPHAGPSLETQLWRIAREDVRAAEPSRH